MKKVISLFDGIGCLWQSLKELGIPVGEAYAYEIDKYAIQVCKANHPNVVHMGSVVGADFTQHKGAELVAGGFPCTDLSIAKNGRKGLDGEYSGLFWELVRAINEIHPRYFFVENNASMPAKDREIITKTLGVEPIMINSALVSAQQRKRLYWTNIPGVGQPEDRGIVLSDILDDNSIPEKEKSNAITTVNTDTMVCEPVIIQRSRGFNKGGVKYGKCPTLTGSSFEQNNHVAVPICVNSKSGRGSKPTAQPSLQDRIYDVNGKMVAITTSHQPKVAESIKINYESHIGQGMRIYSVIDNIICSVSNDEYSGVMLIYRVNLPDGNYLIRKLTPVECERLQTLPDGYTAGISNTQRYKCLGNGWTVEVIKHILSTIIKL